MMLFFGNRPTAKDEDEAKMKRMNHILLKSGSDFVLYGIKNAKTKKTLMIGREGRRGNRVRRGGQV